MTGKRDYPQNRRKCKWVSDKHQFVVLAEVGRTEQNRATNSRFVGRKAEAPTSPKVDALPFSLSSHKENQLNAGILNLSWSPQVAKTLRSACEAVFR